eukprot:TRINITY_DN4239_c0_g1_i2.p1 TRINITY_DN4239_c0_g1~~TRINITY_DN4239_c0_g1_i2.p1  ORF type:complete len:285 (+),score=75.78 TRINITY_DN4239_c0_g1_i2:46-900(+)
MNTNRRWVPLPCRSALWSRIESLLSRAVETIDSLSELLQEVSVLGSDQPVHFFRSYFLQNTDAEDGASSQEGTGSALLMALKKRSSNKMKGDPEVHISKEEFLTTILPTIQALALELPKLFPVDAYPHGIPVLEHDEDCSLVLTKRQVAGIIAHAFFGTWPSQGHDFNDINLNMLYTEASPTGPVCAAILSLLNYFKRWSSPTTSTSIAEATSSSPSSSSTPSNSELSVIYHRKSLAVFPEWKKSNTPLVHMNVRGTVTKEKKTPTTTRNHTKRVMRRSNMEHP